MSDITIDGSEFDAFADKLRAVAEELDDAVDAGVRKTALQVERSAKQETPVDTGTLRSSIQTARVDVGEHIVGTNVEYAPDVEFGTRPHVITPDEADALAFKGTGGEMVFTRRVEHPGTPAQPFLRPAVRDHQSDLVENINDAIADLLEAVF